MKTENGKMGREEEKEKLEKRKPRTKEDVNNSASEEGFGLVVFKKRVRLIEGHERSKVTH